MKANRMVFLRGARIFNISATRPFALGKRREARTQAWPSCCVSASCLGAILPDAEVSLTLSSDNGEPQVMHAADNGEPQVMHAAHIVHPRVAGILISRPTAASSSQPAAALHRPPPYFLQ